MQDKSVSLNPVDELLTSLRKTVERFTVTGDRGLASGALPPKDPTYVYREADGQLEEFLQATARQVTVCYIWAPPDTGKSSLMANTANIFAKGAYVCIQIELVTSVKNVSTASLYYNTLKIICQRVSIKGRKLLEELQEFWSAETEVEPEILFQQFILLVCQAIAPKNLIIFIDEVQQLTDWGLADNFSGLLRNLSGSESLHNLKFVLLGGAHPADLFGNKYKFASTIALSPLRRDSQPLLNRLAKVSNPSAVLSEIISRTGGQPFLTNFLCDLVVKSPNPMVELEIADRVGQLVRREIIPEGRRPVVQSHLSSIENRFVGGDLKKIDRKIAALNLYSKLLADGVKIEYSDRSLVQRDLLIWGLVAKGGKLIEVANPIYRQIFNQTWVAETKQRVIERRNSMPSPKICNRDVYILIDQSGSMVRKDEETGGKVRWEFLTELLESHIYSILKTKVNGEPICEDIILTFFSVNKVCEVNKYITDAGQVVSVFEENMPNGNTFIVPTLEKTINTWFDKREGRAGFIIIYTDGQFDDRDKFMNSIKQTCGRLETEDDLKIIIIGLGRELDEKFYIKLDQNVSNFKDNGGKECNIVVFDVVNQMENIIELLDRQLVDPHAGLAPWAKEKYPELFN